MRTVALNRHSRLFYARTARVLQEMKEARRDILDLQNPQYGDVSFAFLKSLGLHFVPHLIRDFLQQYPHVNFQLFQNSTSVILEQLRRGEIDYCLSLLPELAGIYVKDISKLTLAVYPCNRTIGLAWRKDTYLGAAALKFREFLVDFCSRMNQQESNDWHV